MNLTFTIPGTISTHPKAGTIQDFENVEVEMVVDFNINQDGELIATPISIPKATVYEYDDQDNETPKEITLYCKPSHLKLKGKISGFSLVPSYFHYDTETEKLILEYF